MGNPDHMDLIRQGVAPWNEWRKLVPRVQPDLTHIDLSGVNLDGVDFRGVGLYEATLTNASLKNANLRQARLVKTNLTGADLSGAKIWGISVWDVTLENAIQKDLIITPKGQAIVTVDRIEIAQFIYLLINNKNIRNVIDTISSKVILILGRFKDGRKQYLDEIKRILREKGYVPVIFDFDGPESLDLTETVQTLAHLAKFVVADLTDPSCIPHELASIAPVVTAPIHTLIQKGNTPYAMFADLPRKFAWVKSPLEYTSLGEMEGFVVEFLK